MTYHPSFDRIKKGRLEQYFSKYRAGIIGQNCKLKTPTAKAVPLVYADWTASGRMYLPIEKKMQSCFYPHVANTHTDTNYTGSKTTYAYHKARQIIKSHVGANSDDVLISSNAGMTGVVNKFQRILGLKIHESFQHLVKLEEADRPIVFVTHMEHHSNQTTWLETIADVVVVPPDAEGLVSVDQFKNALQQYQNRKTKIAAITACSNVTGIITPYLDIAALMHQNNGLCFVDFACSAPYVTIDMHPNDAIGRYLDAIYFSPHKFLGGPGTTGILVFNKKLYANNIPDHSGGGTVAWTNPWGEHQYVKDIEAREDGGTPAFLQTIKVAMCLKLKEEMGVANIQEQETELMKPLWSALKQIPNLHILADQHPKRLGIISFYIDQLHHNLGVKMLNDRFGIQTRGGCSCAGTYGHHLLDVSKEQSKKITDKIDTGDYSSKPGWIRLSIHPTMTDAEIKYIIHAITTLASNHKKWQVDYEVDHAVGSIKHKNKQTDSKLVNEVDRCFAGSFY